MKNSIFTVFLFCLFIFFHSSVFAQAEKIIAVEIEEVRAKNLVQSENYVAEVIASKDFEIRTAKEGMIETLTSAKVGNFVKKSTVLATIDYRDAKLSLEKRKAELENAFFNILQQENAYRSSLNRIQVLESEYRLAEKNYNRNKSLFSKQFISEKVFRESKNMYLNQKFNYENERMQILGSSSNLPEAPEETGTFALYQKNRNSLHKVTPKIPKGANYLPLLIAHENFRQAKANYLSEAISLERSKIVAPASGVISAKPFEKSEFVNKGTAIFNFAVIHPISASFFVKETELSQFNPGAKLNLTLDAFPTKPIQGQISEVGAAADPKSRRFKVIVNFPNRKLLYRPGMTARIAFRETAKDAFILIPLGAVVQDAKSNHVFVVEGYNAVRKTVELGNITNDRVEVLKGLKNGEKLVIKGNRVLNDGDRVRVLNVQ